jgi:hypothetical protein
MQFREGGAVARVALLLACSYLSIAAHEKGSTMSDRCDTVRITYRGSVAGDVPQVNLTRSGLDEAQSQTMEEACRQLLTLAEAQATATPNIGADNNLRYRVEIEVKNGGRRDFEIAVNPRRQGVTLGGADVGAIINRLEGLSRSGR